ncbi:MAG: rhamnogalacturonan acetylesterase [Caulobacterales bacterium]|nr:rhamnogalacturonan acetylesterase [Caulobacterales bacterium]
MRQFGKPVVAVCAALTLSIGAAHAQTPAPAPAPIRAVKIVLVGDSTTQVGSGWGGAFCAKHVTSFAACLDLARGGRSSGSYRAEGSWKIALSELANPNYAARYVLIQFGHNDQPGKPGRSTDLATEFPAYLRSYVTEARAVGAVPVLVTPLTRRSFKDGKLENDLEPWAAATRKVAAELHAPLIDLNAESAAAVQAMGALAATRLAQVPPSEAVRAAAATGTTIAASTGVAPAAAPANTAQDNAALEPLGDPKLSFDYTHLGPEGADVFSAMVTRLLARAVPELRKELIR